MKVAAVRGEALLPQGYTQTEHTQSYSVGTQNGASIRTFIRPSTDLVTEMDMEFTSWFSGASSFIFGSDPADKNRYAVYVNANHYWVMGWDGATVSTATADLNTRYKVKLAGGKLYVNGSEIASTTATNVNQTADIILYAYNYTAGGNMPARFAKMKLYGVKFTRGGVLVGDFIPCKRDSDSAPGMYDIVSNRFFPCESIRGTGNYFIAGADVPNLLKFHKFATGLHKCKAILPDALYRDALYVMSRKASHVNTGYVPKANTEMEIRLKFGGTFTYGTGNVNAFFGSIESDGRTYTTNFGNGNNQQNQLFTWLSRTYDGSHTWMLNINDSTRTNVNTLTYTPTKVTYGSFSITPQLKTEDNTHPMTILGRRKADGTVETFTSLNMYVYEWIIREGNTEVIHYVPKQRIADGVYGLYDTISDTFHPSDSNTPFEGEAA